MMDTTPLTPLISRAKIKNDDEEDRPRILVQASSRNNEKTIDAPWRASFFPADD